MNWPSGGESLATCGVDNEDDVVPVVVIGTASGCGRTLISKQFDLDVDALGSKVTDDCAKT